MEPTEERRYFDKKIADARESGDISSLIDALQRAAGRALADLDGKTTRKYLNEANKLAREYGDQLQVARCIYALALLTGQELPGSERAISELKAAYTVLVDVGDTKGAAAARKHLVTYHLEQKNTETALKLAEENVTAGRKLEDIDLVLASMTAIIAAHSTLGDNATALNMLIRAVCFAEYNNLSVVDYELNLLQNIYGTENTKTTLTKELENFGSKNKGANHTILAAQALAEGDLKQCEYHGSAARQIALEIADPVLYILACITISKLRETEKNLPDSLAVLFTCFSSLRELLGEQLAAPVLLLVESAEKRWGETLFAKTLAEYRLNMKQNLKNNT